MDGDQKQQRQQNHTTKKNQSLNYEKLEPISESWPPTIVLSSIFGEKFNSLLLWFCHELLDIILIIQLHRVILPQMESQLIC